MLLAMLSAATACSKLKTKGSQKFNWEPGRSEAPKARREVTQVANEAGLWVLLLRSSLDETWHIWLACSS